MGGEGSIVYLIIRTFKFTIDFLPFTSNSKFVYMFPKSMGDGQLYFDAIFNM